MDKVITSVFLIVASVIAATLVFNAAYPAILASADAMTSMKSRIDERIRSEIAIIHAVKSASYSDVAQVWVKNIGATSIKAVERCDVFFGPEGNFERIPYGAGDRYWTYEVENDTYWNPAATVKITVDLDYMLVQGERYFYKMVTPNGISDEYYFSPSR